MKCQTSITSDVIGAPKVCGHSITQHEGDESGMGGAEPCMMPDCPCQNFTRAVEYPEDFPGPTPETAQYEEYAAAQGFAPVEIRRATRPKKSCATPHCGHAPDEHYDDGPCAANCACEAYSERIDDRTVARQVDPEPGRAAGPDAMKEEHPGFVFGPARVIERESKTVQKWADSAMFTAEPIDAQAGPQVHLLWMTADPLAAIAAPSKMYKGEVARSLRDVTHAERGDYLKQISATKLKAPFEFVKFHFLIEGVTRAFTHQMVRQRMAVYAQESLRFAVKSERGLATPVALPPSLAGTKSAMDRPDGMDTEQEYQRDLWDDALVAVDNAYAELIERGMPAEDARGLLPHNTLTRLHYCTDLRSLLDHAGNRLCTQAQFEWRLVFAKIAQAIREYNPYAGLMEMARNGIGGDEGELTREWLAHCAESDRWQYEAIADLFRPVCYQTGKCEFKANFDRKCSIRDRVDAFHAKGVPSSQWGPTDCDGTQDCVHMKHDIRAILPAEWLLDPGAAR